MGFDLRPDSRSGQAEPGEGQEGFTHSSSLPESTSGGPRRKAPHLQEGDDRGDEHGTASEDGARRLSDPGHRHQQDPGPSVQSSGTGYPDFARTGGKVDMATA